VCAVCCRGRGRPCPRAGSGRRAPTAPHVEAGGQGATQLRQVQDRARGEAVAVPGGAPDGGPQCPTALSTCPMRTSSPEIAPAHHARRYVRAPRSRHTGDGGAGDVTSEPHASATNARPHIGRAAAARRRGGQARDHKPLLRAWSVAVRPTTPQGDQVALPDRRMRPEVTVDHRRPRAPAGRSSR
jgi:hypothetical protein